MGEIRERMDPDWGAGSRGRVRRRINVKKRRRGGEKGEAHNVVSHALCLTITNI